MGLVLMDRGQLHLRALLKLGRFVKCEVKLGRFLLEKCCGRKYPPCTDRPVTGDVSV